MISTRPWRKDLNKIAAEPRFIRAGRLVHAYLVRHLSASPVYEYAYLFGIGLNLGKVYDLRATKRFSEPICWLRTALDQFLVGYFEKAKVIMPLTICDLVD